MGYGGLPPREFCEATPSKTSKAPFGRIACTVFSYYCLYLLLFLFIDLMLRWTSRPF